MLYSWNDIVFFFYRRFDSEASLELTSTFPRLQDVKTMQMDGKDMVVIDVETYSHIMEELAMLKMKLSQLTDFLQVRKYQKWRNKCQSQENFLIASYKLVKLVEVNQGSKLNKHLIITRCISIQFDW